MGNIRRKFGAEFKREAVRQALQPGNAVATVWSWTCPVSMDGLNVLDRLGIFNQIDLTVAVN